MNFPRALLFALNNGQAITRWGWNGKGMSVVYVPADAYQVDPALLANARPRPFLVMRTADGGFVPWLASQTDVLATDWTVVSLSDMRNLVNVPVRGDGVDLSNEALLDEQGKGPFDEPESDRLARLISLQEGKDQAYNERNRVVALLARMCLRLGYKVKLTRTDIADWDPAWCNCVYIQLPTGQVSWHFHDNEAYLFFGLPRGDEVWDGHTTEEKYLRDHKAL